MVGMPEALVYFSAKNNKNAGEYLASSIILALLISIPFMAICYILIPYLLSAQSKQTVNSALWYIFLIPLYVLVGLPYNPLRGIQKFGLWNILRILPTIGWLSVLCLGFIINEKSPGFVSKAYLISLFFLIFPVNLIVKKNILGKYRPRMKYWNDLLAFGLPSAVSSLPQMLNYRLDQMIMAAFLPSYSLGLYIVGVTWANIIAPILSAIGNVIFPKVAGETSLCQQAKIFTQSIRITIIFSLFLGILLLIITPKALPLVFGNSFKEAVSAALILVFAGIISGINLVLEEGLRGLGKPKAVLFAEISGLPITAMLLYLLLPRFGIIGAAMASLLTYALVNILLIWQSTKFTNFSASLFLFPSYKDFEYIFLKLKNLIKL